MTPTEFIEGLAEVMKVQRTELATVDRALAKHGLRQIARGRSRPNIKLIEGIQIACAWAGATKLTDAAKEIERQRNCFVSRDRDADELGIEYPFDIKFHEVLGGNLKGLDGKNFLDVVAIVTRQIGRNKYPSRDLGVSIEKEESVEIFWKTEDGKAQVFFQELSARPVFRPRNVVVKVVILGQVLKWIYDATEGA